MEEKLKEILTKETKNEVIGITNYNIFNKGNFIKSKKAYFCSNNLNELFSFNIMEDIRVKVKKVKGDKLYELFKTFGLGKDILDRTYKTLSTSEKKKILLICAIISDKDIIVFQNPSHYLDNKGKESLIRELKRLKRNKTILINTDDTEFLLEAVDQLVLVNKDGKTISGNKYDILSNEKLLESVSLPIPSILHFINKVYALKKVKLKYRDNINDTIKDVYRYV